MFVDTICTGCGFGDAELLFVLPLSEIRKTNLVIGLALGLQFLFLFLKLGVPTSLISLATHLVDGLFILGELLLALSPFISREIGRICASQFLLVDLTSQESFSEERFSSKSPRKR